MVRRWSAAFGGKWSSEAAILSGQREILHLCVAAFFANAS
jgi:hypothetical protein